MAGYRIFLNRQNSNFSLTAPLTDHSHKARGQTKQRTATTITNSPMGCAFWGSDECRPSAPCLFFHLQPGCLSSSSSTETISRRSIFCINTFFQQHVWMPQNYFRAGFQKHFSPGATIRLDMSKFAIGILFAIGSRCW